MKKIIILPILLLLIISLCSCSTATKTIDVEIICESQGFSIADSIELPENADSAEYFRQLCNKKDITITGVDDGFITDINGIKNEDNYAWMFYINNELAEVGTKNYTPDDGDTISLKYIDWSNLFN